MTDEFFIGWSNKPGPRTRLFLTTVAAIVLIGLAALAATLSRSIGDPGQALFEPNTVVQSAQDVTLSGTLTADPYPIVMLPPDAAHPRGHGVLLTGDGKHGAAFDRAALEGARVEIKGVLLKRGTLDMLVIGEGPTRTSVAAISPGAASVGIVPLGRWRLIGEICDGKCAAGAMSPGTGLAHKACANLCLFGNVPPVFVSAVPLDGQQFLVLADEHGRALDDRVRDLVAMRVALEGEIERRGDMLVLRTDLGRARRL